VSFFLILIAAATIVLGIMNSMYIAVRERTREIGTVRAIGMGKWSILSMFMVEAVFLGIGATALGGGLGALVAKLIDVAKLRVPSEAVQAVLMSDTLHLLVTPGQIMGAIVTFTTITALSALWPAFRASRLQPVQAIQSTT
jgi:putative ABC transport system permease protein